MAVKFLFWALALVWALQAALALFDVGRVIYAAAWGGPLALNPYEVIALSQNAIAEGASQQFLQKLPPIIYLPLFLGYGVHALLLILWTGLWLLLARRVAPGPHSVLLSKVLLLIAFSLGVFKEIEAQWLSHYTFRNYGFFLHNGDIYTDAPNPASALYSIVLFGLIPLMIYIGGSYLIGQRRLRERVDKLEAERRP